MAAQMVFFSMFFPKKTRTLVPLSESGFIKIIYQKLLNVIIPTLAIYELTNEKLLPLFQVFQNESSLTIFLLGYFNIDLYIKI